MLSRENMQAQCLADEDLGQISGGNNVIMDERGVEIREGRFVTYTLTSYASGDSPKFSVGESVKIKWKISADLETMCDAEVIGISDGKDGGLLFRRYTYSVRILSCPNSDMIGQIETEVHENCLSH